MTQADTQAMMSLGVKERAVGHYEVHLVKSADSTSCGEQATSTPSEVNSTSNKSFAAPGYHAADTYDDVVEVEATDSLKLPAVEIATHSEPEMTKSDERADLEVQEAADVEKWRQDVGTVDATSNTQARIDALLTASEEAKGKADEETMEQNPRRERAKAGLVPGKKIYCTHWIRTGECDFIQQGCLYKHEMPDGATLKAIGYHALPPWYLVAHPEKARDRGYCVPGGAFNRFGGGRPDSPMAASPGAFRAASQPHHPPFYPSQRLDFRSRANAPLTPPSRHSWASTQGPFYPNAEPHSASPRIQELPEQQYQQWQAANHQSHARELQITRRPFRSPGYNTFAFQPPHLVSPSESHPDSPQAKPAAPMWEPRTSKLAHRPTPHEGEKFRRSPSSDDTDIRKPEPVGVQVKREGTESPPSGPSPAGRVQILGSNSQRIKTSHDKVSSSPDAQRAAPAVKPHSGRSPAINAIFAPLEPSAPLPKAPVSTRQDREPNFSSDLFASFPNVPAAPAHRRFVPRGEDGRAAITSGSKLSEASKRMLKHDIKDTAAAASPEKERLGKKRAAHGHIGSSELLLDFESTAGD
ncbi:MAG: hypothetical protein L6R37_004200 [Teloschistes peruensis]|nr:MAG: hypothetical protein L6R37_004200 [Teloschistes peruensis]